jgi:putative membrane protein
MEPLSGKRRVHPSYILTGTIRNLYKWIVVFIVSLAGTIRNIPQFDEYGGFSLRNPFLFFPILILLILVCVAGVLQYFHLSWEVTDRDIRLRKGIFKRTDSRIPFERIHSVNVKASLIEQMFGVVGFSLDTAGGHEKDDLIIPSLKKPIAEALKHYIYVKKGLIDGETGAPFAQGQPPFAGNAIPPGTAAPFAQGQPPFAQGQPPFAQGQAPVHAYGANAAYGRTTDGRRAGAADRAAHSGSYRIRPFELCLHGFSNGSAILYLFLGVSFLSQFRDLPIIGDIVSGLMGSAYQRVVSFSIFFLILIALVILLIAWIASVIASVLKFFGFVVQRRGNRIETERGLLTHKTTGCAVDRIQELHIRRPLLRRLIGYAEIRVRMAAIITGNQDTSDGPGVTIHPFIRHRDIDGFLNEILPEFANAPKVETGLPLASLRRTYFRYFRWSAVFLSAICPSVWLLLRTFAPDAPRAQILIVALILILFFLCVTAYRSWKGRGMATNAAFLVMKRGAYTATTAIIPRKKIQLARIRQNPFQTKAGVAHIEASSAAMGGAFERVRDVGAAQAFAYLDWIRPRPQGADAAGGVGDSHR